MLGLALLGLGIAQIVCCSSLISENLNKQIPGGVYEKESPCTVFPLFSLVEESVATVSCTVSLESEDA